MRPFFLRSAFVLVTVFLLNTGFFKSRPIEKAPESLMLCDAQKPEENPAYIKLFKLEDPALLEHAKIDYLINRIRCSPFKFIRNGQPHTGPRAAQHLLWKYHLKHGDIETASDFIIHIASGSSLSGQPYMLKLPSGESYRVQEVLQNELRVLETLLSGNKPLPEPEPVKT